MLTISSSSLTPAVRRPVIHRRRYSLSSSDLYRPRTIIIEKPTTTASFGFSIQTYGFAALNILPTDESACSLLSLSSESTASLKSSTSNSFSSSSQIAPIQLVTYVDHVQDKSPAWEAGLRSGSVILSVNDQTVEHDDHETLVKRITQASQTQLKLVILQQNINKQIALCEQLQQLHKQLHEKEEELEELCKQEMNSEGDQSIQGKKMKLLFVFFLNIEYL
jgi:molybdopterin converting factor small subunit